MSASIMDSPASPRTDANINDVSGLYFKIEHDSTFPSTVKKKTTVVKYTKLPDFEFESKVCQGLKPRLRRIIELDDPPLQTSRSLKLGTVSAAKMNPTSKRKIVSILENEENKLTPNVTTPSVGRITNYTNRSSATASKYDKTAVQKTSSRLTNPGKFSRDPKLSAQTGNTMNKKDFVGSKATIRSKQAIISNHTLHDNMRSRITKDQSQGMKNTSIPPKVNLSKNLVIPSDSEKVLTSIKNDLVKSLNHTPSSKRLERHRLNNRITPNKNKNVLLKEIPLSKPITVIHVPLDNDYGTNFEMQDKVKRSDVPILVTDSVDCGTDIDQQFLPKDANVGTPPQPTMVNEETETTLANEITRDVFDNLDIPNVTLIKDKNTFAKDEIVKFCSRSLPNLQAPAFKISPDKENDGSSVGLGKSKTYIIGRATFTYTTKQKINFHVVGSSDDSQSNQSPSPLAYPLSVVSLLKKNLDHCDISESSEEECLPNKKDKSSICHKNVDELQALTSRDNNNDRLVKPSDLISTIRVNNGLLHNDYISEQFQRELHFIDSFFESLQYLESCSLSEKCFSEATTSENWVSKTRLNLKNSEYNSFLSKLENGAGALTHVDDIETMASKSLCLLNLLIRDEQRRAKNLLFVLKMREDALKDFTKSQIIWLENKKKQDNTDVSTLKKKQRGALLKLQHECGEMQRMRKALLTLSERRKAALMKTRNNIELKLHNNVNVDQILLGKKKLKRNTAADRNVAPLKCFDLSSSGCEESASSKPKLETPFLPQELVPTNSCAEKCVQTGDSIFEPRKVDHMSDTADENFVAVDGGYLNILFQHLALPQIFSSGKQYEVNEEALKNVVESSNKPHPKDHFDSDVVENFMDKIRNRDSDRSSSLSTAHSLVDEFDQYYKGLSDGSKSSLDSPDTEHHNVTSAPQAQVYEISESCVQAVDIQPEHIDKSCGVSSITIVGESVEPITSSNTIICESRVFESLNQILETDSLRTSDVSVTSGQTGPLPVPPGATSPEPVVTDGSDSSTISSDIGSRSDERDSVISLSSGQSEAEELRRQQLAIEREIKALEQQQNQLLVVREIPDKPPPPYTPPNNGAHKTSPMFVMTEEVEEKIHRHVTLGDELTCDPRNPFSIFMKDICEESLARQKLEQSDDPWDACNLLPYKQEATPDKRGQNTIAEINQILSRVPPTVVSGVGARRSDHIDDILFAEWRRCEPEWTALQADEAAVKNQVFESLFQKVLNETIDQYKQIVIGLTSSDDASEKRSRKKSIQTKSGET